MKIRGKYGRWLLCLLLLGTISSLYAQLQQPGRIRGDFRSSDAAGMIYLLPPPDPLKIQSLSMDQGGPAFKPARHALQREVDISPEYHGVWSEEEGWRIWRVHLISSQARSLGLVFDRFRLEEGIALMVYSPDRKNKKGAFGQHNNNEGGILAVGRIPGDELIIELQVPPGMSTFGQLELGSLVHAFMDCPGDFGCAQDCEIDLQCTEGQIWDLEKRSVVRIDIFGSYCTGVMINNTAYDGEPLLLTAKHCIEEEYQAAGSIFYFNYESPSCFGGDGSRDWSRSGAEILSLGDSIDFCLLRLLNPPPDSFGVYYAGWDLERQPEALTTCLHHPQGDVKKVSYDFQAPSTPAGKEDTHPNFWQLRYDSFWWIKQWDVGSTEEGSSGSPLFNKQKQVIGLLSWGSARCGDSLTYHPGSGRVEYDKEVNVDDYFTKLNMAWDHNEEEDQSLQSWLDPAGSGVTSLEGYYPSNVRIPEIRPEASYLVYPNPARDELFIHPRTPHAGQDLLYHITDLEGRLLKSGRLEGGAGSSLELGGLANGIYLLRIEGGKRKEIHKIMVQR